MLCYRAVSLLVPAGCGGVHDQDGHFHWANSARPSVSEPAANPAPPGPEIAGPQMARDWMESERPHLCAAAELAAAERHRPCRWLP
jgi:hypothetical protein